MQRIHLILDQRFVFPIKPFSAHVVPLVRVTGVEPVRIKRRILSPLGLPIPPYSHGVFTGPAYRNRTHIRGVEIRCIIHYTNARIGGP